MNGLIDLLHVDAIVYESIDEDYDKIDGLDWNQAFIRKLCGFMFIALIRNILHIRRKASGTSLTNTTQEEYEEWRLEDASRGD